ncbi:MAG: hypothetical protein WC542_13920 [Paludibacter sp.]
MSRCTQTTNIEVRHLRSDGGNGINNAIVLCKICNAAIGFYDKNNVKPEPFSQVVIEKALKKAENRCQCTCKIHGCH